MAKQYLLTMQNPSTTRVTTCYKAFESATCTWRLQHLYDWILVNSLIEEGAKVTTFNPDGASEEDKSICYKNGHLEYRCNHKLIQTMMTSIDCLGVYELYDFCTYDADGDRWYCVVTRIDDTEYEDTED